MERAGSRSATIAARLIETRERLIGALLLGNNLVNILASVLATRVLIELFGEAGIVYATLAMTALVVVFYLLTRTDFGVERAGRFAVDRLRSSIDGELRVGSVTSRGLLRGVTLHDVAIDDAEGRPFLRADSARLAYHLTTILGGDIAFDRLIVYAPVVHIELLPGGDRWNYERVFPGDTAAPDTTARGLVQIDDATIHDGLVFVRFPFEPEDPVEPARTITSTSKVGRSSAATGLTIAAGAPSFDGEYNDAGVFVGEGGGFDAPGAYFLLVLHGDLTIVSTFTISADFLLKVTEEGLELGFNGSLDLGGFASLDVDGGAVVLTSPPFDPGDSTSVSAWAGTGGKSACRSPSPTPCGIPSDPNRRSTPGTYQASSTARRRGRHERWPRFATFSAMRTMERSPARSCGSCAHFTSVASTKVPAATRRYGSPICCATWRAVGGISAKDYAKLTGKKSNYPLLNRAIQGQSAPGSVFKVIPTAAAVNAGYSFNGPYQCSSSYSIGGQVFKNFESQSHGAISLGKALEGEVRFDRFSRGRYATDASHYQVMPVAVATPRHAADMAAALAIARESGVSVLARGGGTSQCGQAINESLVLDTTRHVNRIIEIDAANRRCIVEPGIVLDERHPPWIGAQRPQLGHIPQQVDARKPVCYGLLQKTQRLVRLLGVAHDLPAPGSAEGLLDELRRAHARLVARHPEFEDYCPSVLAYDLAHSTAAVEMSATLLDRPPPDPERFLAALDEWKAQHGYPFFTLPEGEVAIDESSGDRTGCACDCDDHLSCLRARRARRCRRSPNART